MGFSDIRALKKETITETTSRFVRHLIVGEDVHTVALYKTLIEKFGEAEVKLLCKKELSLAEVRPKGPSLLRGENNIKLFKDFFPEVEIRISEVEAEYFKEQEFRKFSGKGKPETLQWGEEFYREAGAHVDITKIYPFLNDEGLFKALNQTKIGNTLTKIEKIDPTDLIENGHWLLETSIGETIHSEFVYWGQGPQEFLNLYKDKSELPDEFIEFCESTVAPSSLYVKFIFDGPITDKLETLFIPLSYTHEWGHFIGEFGEENGKQSIEFILYVDVNQQTEEDISRKIRLLKRHIEKIFKKAKNILSTEYITLAPYTACLNIDDNLYQKGCSEMHNLLILSENGPFEDVETLKLTCEDSVSMPTHLMRGLVKQKFIEQKIV